jgi:DNA-directed RNA polymerase subunit H
MDFFLQKMSDPDVSVRVLLSESFLGTLGQVKRTQLHMVRDRGYELSALEKELVEADGRDVSRVFLSLALDARISLFAAMNASYAAVEERPPLRVIYIDRNFDDTKLSDKMISSDQIKDALNFVSSLTDEERICKEICVMLVGSFKLSTEGKRELEKLSVSSSSPSLRVQFFLYDDLLFPVVKHELVPPHIALTRSETASFWKERNVSPGQLCTLKTTDPVSLYYDYRPGTVVRIERGIMTAFREVMD